MVGSTTSAAEALRQVQQVPSVRRRLPWALVGLGLLCDFASAAPAYVQSNYATPQSSQTTVSVTYTSAQAAGNINVVVVGWNDSVAHVQSVTDSRGRNYVLAVGPTVLSGFATQAIYYAANISASGANTNAVTVTFNAPAAYADIRIAEYSGIDPANPLDTGVEATGNSATSNSGSVTTSNANDLLVGANLVQTRTTGAGTGFTSRIITNPDSDILEDRVVTAIGSYSATAPLSPAGPWIMQMLALRAAGGGADTQAPTAPTNLGATAASSSQINLSWTASTDNVGVTGYRVERCQGAGCSNFGQIATPAGTTFGDSGLTANTSYSYRVRAADAAGNLSAYSSVASATTQAAVDTQPPTAPTNLGATAASSSQINLSWTASTDNVGVTGYLVERCQGAGCSNFAQIATPTGTTLNDSGLAANTSYSYRVRATDAAGNLSGYSNTATTVTQSADTQAPTAPANLGATAASSSQINLSWTASTDNVGVTGYRVERCQGAGCSNFGQIAAPAGTTFSDSGLAANTSYSYRVRAADAAGNLSGYSGTANATTLATAAGLVAAYSFDEGAGTTVADASGIGNTGTVANGSWTTAGKFNSALVFNGTSSRVTINDAVSLRLTTGMTLEAWVYPATASGQWRDVIYKGDDNYYLEGTSTTNGTPAGGGTFKSGPLFGTSPLPLNTWSHLALTYDKVTLRLYVNGVQVASAAATANIATSTNPLQIGGDSLYGQYFNGRIDEVRVYNLALSPAQIQSDMVTPIGTGTPPPPDTQAPTAPTNLGATAASSSQINLSWTASTDNVGVTGYRVERCQGAGCSNFGQIATPAGTTFGDSGLTANTSYSYRVRAADAAGNLSAYSSVASATTQAAVDTQPPTAPTNLGATAASSSQINLSWTASTDNVGVTGYLVERCQGAGCSNFAQIATPTGTTLNDSGLAANTSYSYRVRATDAAGNLSGYSNTATTVTQSADTQAPTAPANLGATAASSSQINLSWTASTDNVGVTGYRVERCQGAGCSNFGQIAAPAGTTFSDSGLAANTSYSYRVRAADAAGNLSGYSGTANATTLATAAGLVAAYSFDEGAGTTVADASGIGNTGTVANGSWTTAGKFNSALVFNGTSSRVTINDAVSLRLTTGMTLEAWVYPATASGQWRDVIYKGDDNYYLEGTSTTNGTPAGGGTFKSSPLFGTSPLPLNTWSHLALTYDKVTLRLYVNGVQVASAAATANIATSTNPLQIGGDSLYGQYFNGRIDEVRVYNLALSAAQIQSDMVTPIGTGTLPPPDTQPPTVSIITPAPGSSQTGTITLSANAADARTGVSGVQFQIDGINVGAVAAPHLIRCRSIPLSSPTAHTRLERTPGMRY